jgi:hypothetical protein
MTRLTDRTKTVEITMTMWDGNNHSPDWSADFFEVGSLDYDDTLDAYIVEDVDYCVEQAQDWQKAQGDFYESDPTDLDDRCVFVVSV